MKKQFSPEQKIKVAIAAASGMLTLSEVASKFEVHPTQVRKWRDELKNRASDIFDDGRSKTSRDKELQAQIDELHRVIGKREAELEWLKKRRALLIHEARELIDWDHPEISVSRQCELLGINRSSLYYKPYISDTQLALDKLHMDAIDEIYTKYPFFGQRRIKVILEIQYDIHIDRLRIGNVMKRLGIEAIYPKPRLSIPEKSHFKYPYLLKGLKIDTPNHVWAADITYIRIRYGFAYLVAFMDWYSRFVISWRLSNSLEDDFCIEALRDGLEIGKPEISNTDQGSQFTGDDFIKELTKNEITISMDGVGRYLDNIFIERLWRSLKYENVYINHYQSIPEATEGIAEYFQLYNYERPHQSLRNQTPASLYFKAT